MLDVLIYWSQLRFVGLRAMLQDYVRQLANTVLPQGHIWGQIRVSLCLPDPEHAELVTQGWRCLVGPLKRNVGKFSESCVRSKADW
jgi:hypothetical protein